jgi:hypothetical protein
MSRNCYKWDQSVAVDPKAVAGVFALASRTAVSTGSFSMTCMTANTLAVAPPADKFDVVAGVGCRTSDHFTA